ncbi:MAG: hypothetical protein IT258_19735 [Saprospiraceae bacterium]|nr:hypothetical protein [Saprospiraceae bacterium]
MEINRTTNNVRIYDTVTKDTYKGFIHYFPGYAFVRFATDDSENFRVNRVGSFTIKCTNSILNEQKTIGLFQNISHLEKPYASIVVMQRISHYDPNDYSAELPIALIRFFEFLDKETYIECDFKDWERLQKLDLSVAGQLEAL